MSLILAGLSALLFGIADFAGGFAAGKSPVLAVLLVSQGAGTLVALAALAASGQALPALGAWTWGWAAGIAGAFGLFCLYRGLSRGIVAIVSPASAIVGAAIPVAFGLILGERPSTWAAIGSALCLPAVFLLSWSAEGSRRGHTLSSLGWGICSGIGFGAFFLAISRSPADSGLWPVLAARTSSMSLLLCVAALTRTRLAVSRDNLRFVVLAGVADMGANVLFLVATRTGLLSLVAIVSSLFPAPTVVLARLVLKQKIPASRMAGLALAILGVAMIGAG